MSSLVYRFSTRACHARKLGSTPRRREPFYLAFFLRYVASLLKEITAVTQFHVRHFPAVRKFKKIKFIQ